MLRAVLCTACNVDPIFPGNMTVAATTLLTAMTNIAVSFTNSAFLLVRHVL